MRKKFSSNDSLQADTQVCNCRCTLIYVRLIPIFFFFFNTGVQTKIISHLTFRRFHAPACFAKTRSPSKLQQRHEMEAKPHSKYRGDSAAPEDERCTSSMSSGTVCAAHFAAAAARVTNDSVGPVNSRRAETESRETRALTDGPSGSWSHFDWFFPISRPSHMVHRKEAI